MKRIKLPLPWSLLAGLVLLSATCDALKGNVLVLNKLKSKPDETPAPSPEDKTVVEEAVGNGTLAEAAANSSKPALTGIPQLDYVHDPNLPRELNGYNLKDYPFYDRVPEEMDFKCDGLHDGFYASVLHKCQVYHHCLFGTRFDFLCANYTAFDQKTFICHFVSEVDCVNSPKYFIRNEALYKSASTTTLPPPRTTEPPPPPPPRRQVESEPDSAPRRRRPFRRRRPVYEYVYDDEYDELEYDDDAAVSQGRSSSSRAPRPAADDSPRRKRPRPQQRPAPAQDDYQDTPPAESTAADLKPKPSSSVYDRPRMAPKIRRPVPLSERDKYDYGKNSNIVTTPANVEQARVESNPRPKQQQSTPTRTVEDDYYYDDEEEYVQPSRSTQGHSNSRPKVAQDYYHGDEDIERRPPKTGGGGSPRRTLGQVGSRKRVIGTTADTTTQYSSRHESDEYDDLYDETPRRVVRPSGGRRRVKDNPREDEDYVRRPVQANGYKTRPRSKPQRYEPEDYYLDEDPVPATRPAYISRPQSSRDGYASRRRPQQPADTTAPDYVPPRSQAASDYKRPAGAKPSPGRYTTGYASDAEYYDDTEDLLDEPENHRSRQKETAAPSRSTGNQYQSAAREDDIVSSPVKTRPYSSNSRPASSSPPAYQSQSPQYSSGKSQPARNYPPTSLSETEDRPRPQQPALYREKPIEEDRDRSPGTRRNNRDQVSDPAPIETPAQLVPKGFTPQSSSNNEDTYINANPSRIITSPGSDEHRRRLPSQDSLSPRTPSTATGINSYQPKAGSSGDSLSRMPFGKYRNPGVDPESISISPATTERATETAVSTRPATSKDYSGNKTSADYSSLSPRGGSNFPRPLGKLAVKPIARERENIHIIPEDEPLRHNLADVNDDDDVARNDVLSPSIPSTRSIPSGPAYLKSGDGQPRFRVKLFKSKLTPQLTSPQTPSQSFPMNTSNYDSTDVELSSSLAGGGGSGGGDSRGYLVTSASQTQYTRAPFSTHSKDFILEGSASETDDQTGSDVPVSSVSGSFNQRHLDQYSSSPKRASYSGLPAAEYAYTPQSRPQVWSQQRKRSSSQYLSSPN